jgi:hypothetical protein
MYSWCNKNPLPRVSTRCPDESMQGIRRQISAKVLQEYLETMVSAQSFQLSNTRHWTLIQCYAELQFKLNGGSKCPMCKAHVRHVVPVRAERPDGTVQEFECLCTRCFEGERAISKVITLHLGEAAVEQYPRKYGAKTSQVQSSSATTNGTGKH